ncbi:MAG: GIY-YIG nuclease family protein [Silvibacterium sp.]|nr:GIY-YIG nuclease family protein [Silvibacterium sp.]
MPEMVTIAEISKRLGVDARTVRRLIARESDALQVTLHRGKGLLLLLNKDDAEKLITSYEARRGPLASTTNGNEAGTATYDRYGYFYIIQLVPEALPNRVKIGFADDVDRRLNEHRTAAPTAILLKTWPCKRSWDYAVMDCITRTECKLVLNEVFEGNPQGFVDRGDTFFALMPNPDSERELSQYSPLFEPDEQGTSSSISC